MTESVILQIICANGMDGDQLKPGGAIGMNRIRFNRAEWRAFDGASIIIPDGGELVIRRTGPTIEILRRST